MPMRLIPLAVLLLTTSGCLKGKLEFRHGDCEADQAKTKFGNCAAVSAPTVTLATSASPTNANPILVTATFSQEVEDFAASRVSISNASVASISGAGKDFVLSITPVKDGEITLSLSAGAAKNFAGTPSAASNQLSVTYDGTAPKLSFVSINRSAIDMSTTSDPTLNLKLSEAAKVTLYKDDTCSVSISAATDLQGSSGQTIKVDGIERASKTRIYGKAVDIAGNESACVSLATYSHILKFIDPNPGASNGFGTHIVELSNGNVVISSPQATVNGVSQAGAVYLFNGETGALISTLYGSTASDQVGGQGVTALTNGNYVVNTRYWDNGATPDVGAITFGNGMTGVSGAVSSSNSLVGSTASDWLGIDGVTALTNGNYVVSSAHWDNGGAVDAGAVTFGNGTTGITGVVSMANSLVGTTSSDWAGPVIALTNGNYVAIRPYWDDGGTTNVGAATFGNGTTGVSGAISAANSLVGSSASDRIGVNGAKALSNGNYVVISQNWRNGGATNAGAVTFGDGMTGIVGAVSSANSLVGSVANDNVGSGGVAPLSNGNYVVASPFWGCPAGSHASCPALVTNAGAATWGNGTSGSNGPVTPSNSLFGTTANDYVSESGVVALSNGNYVVANRRWDCPAGSHASCPALVTDAGAVTWGDGATGSTGPVTPDNSLFGVTANDQLAFSGVTALSSGNYVVASSNWDCPAGSHANCATLVTNAGAVTWGNGTTGSAGPVTPSNSLFGSMANDQVGGQGVTVLSNGNYVVKSQNWDCPFGSHVSCPGIILNAGAVTWGDGTTGIIGPVTPSNSLFGPTGTDQVGSAGVTALTNGNYIVRSQNWDGVSTNVGAVTFGNGASGSSGPVSFSNSLVGSAASDQVGNSTATPTSDGKLIFSSSAYRGNLGLVIKIPGDSGIAGSL